VWAALIFGLSSVPGTSFPTVQVPQSDKLAHLVLYAVMGALAFRAARLTYPRAAQRRWIAALIAIAVATLYGISDELHQSFTPFRTPDWHDVVADALGGAVGAAAMMTIVPWMKNLGSFMMGRSDD
jgi:VanZ family protein